MLKSIPGKGHPLKPFEYRNHFDPKLIWGQFCHNVRETLPVAYREHKLPAFCIGITFWSSSRWGFVHFGLGTPSHPNLFAFHLLPSCSVFMGFFCLPLYSGHFTRDLTEITSTFSSIESPLSYAYTLNPFHLSVYSRVCVWAHISLELGRLVLMRASWTAVSSIHFSHSK